MVEPGAQQPDEDEGELACRLQQAKSGDVRALHSTLAALGERGRYTPLCTEPGATRLNQVFSEGVHSLQQEVSGPFERALAFFLFGALQQFFFDGNKRTSRFMMNGILMTAGIDSISVPAARAQEFNTKMVDFYVTRDAAAMMDFLTDCHPAADQLRARL